jgi:hypothetical protein
MEIKQNKAGAGAAVLIVVVVVYFSSLLYSLYIH